jgi:uncharacterized protein YsxB (DUF464 family)
MTIKGWINDDSIITVTGRRAKSVSIVCCGIATILANAVDELDSLTQASEVQ